MDKYKVEKIKKVVIEVALICAMFCIPWSVGRIVFHDIPTMIRGYEYVTIETEYDDNFMGIPQEEITKKQKKKISFWDASGDLITNLATLIISVGLFVEVLYGRNDDY